MPKEAGKERKGNKKTDGRNGKQIAKCYNENQPYQYLH